MVVLDAVNVEYLFANSFLNVEFKLVFSSLLIERFFSSFLLSAIRVVSFSCGMNRDIISLVYYCIPRIC